MVTRSKHGIYKPKALQVTHDYTVIEPPPFAIAAKHLQWVAATDDEFKSLQQQKTWSLVPRPANKNIVTCKWVYKLKRNSDGSIARYKARLVVRGYLQQYGLDYEETFSPVLKLAIVRLILALVVNQNWELRQLDVSNTFLHGFLRRKFIWLNLKGMLTLNFLSMSASSIRLSMVLSKPLGPGLRGLPLNCFTLVSLPQVLVVISSFTSMVVIWSSFYCMLMISF